MTEVFSVNLAAGDPRTLVSALAEVAKYIEAAAGPENEARAALSSYRLLFPALICHRGAWIRSDRFDAKIADQWFSQPGATKDGVELTMNHLDLLEDFPYGDPDTPVEAANAIAAVLGFVWPKWIKAMYGLDIEFVVHMAEHDITSHVSTVSFSSRT